jgi:hypothetical protein
VVAELAADIEASLVIAGAEVGVPGFGVTEQVPVALWRPPACAAFAGRMVVVQLLG